MPVPKGTFPERMDKIPLWQKLTMHHIQVQDKSRVMEEIRKQLIDEGDALFSTGESWKATLVQQDSLDKAFLTDPVEYQMMVRECLVYEVDCHVSMAVQAYFVEQADSPGIPRYPELMDRVLGVLELVGKEDDDEWIDYLMEKHEHAAEERIKYNDQMGRYIKLLMEHDEAGLIGDPDAFKQRNAIWED